MWKAILQVVAFTTLAVTSPARTAAVSGTRGAGDFPLVHEKSAADVWVAASDHKVARIAAADFAADVERVTGVRPRLRQSGEPLKTRAVWIGTLGHSSKIDDLVRRRKLNVDGIRGNRECFLMEVVPDPEAGVRQALVIVGSDRRGTAFGVYDLPCGSVFPQHCGVREDLSRDRWCEGDLATEVQGSAVSGVGRGSGLSPRPPR